jgi:hypothetical protein
MSSEIATTVFRATRPFFGEFITKGAPSFYGVDKRMKLFEPVAYHLSRGSSVQLSDRNWRTVALESEDFGVDEVFSMRK